MAVVPMTASNPNEIPPVGLQQLDHLTHLRWHGSTQATRTDRTTRSATTILAKSVALMANGLLSHTERR